jgi:hypothetical protein
MEGNVEGDVRIEALTSKCPWAAESTDSRSILGTNVVYVPWGWKCEEDGSYRDTVTNGTQHYLPPGPPLRENFLFKALGAQLCLQEVEAFEQQWQGVQPSQNWIEPNTSLERVRTAARSLIGMGSDSLDEGRSDFDDLLVSSRIESKLSRDQNVQYANRLEALEAISRASWQLLCMLKGFCVLLSEFSTPLGGQDRISEFQRAWTSLDLAEHSGTITEYCFKHLSVDLQAFKDSYRHSASTQTAVSLAQDYVAAIARARAELHVLAIKTPWKAEIVAVKWNSPLPHVSRFSSL